MPRFYRIFRLFLEILAVQAFLLPEFDGMSA